VIRRGGFDVLRLTDKFPSVLAQHLPEFLRVAQPLRPRYYSASSSPRVHGDGIVQLTVGLAVTPVPGRPGRQAASSPARARATCTACARATGLNVSVTAPTGSGCSRTRPSR